MSEAEKSLEELFEEAWSGNKESLEKLLEAIRPIMARAIRRVFKGNPTFDAQVDECLQDALTFIVKKLVKRTGDPTVHSVESFAATVAANRARNLIRDSRPTKSLPEDPGQAPPDPHTTPTRHVTREDDKEKVNKALKQFGEEERLIVKMHYIEGQSYGEIAQVVGKSENAVRQQCYRLRKKLRDILGSGYDPRT